MFPVSFTSWCWNSCSCSSKKTSFERIRRLDQIVDLTPTNLLRFHRYKYAVFFELFPNSSFYSIWSAPPPMSESIDHESFFDCYSKLPIENGDWRTRWISWTSVSQLVPNWHPCVSRYRGWLSSLYRHRHSNKFSVTIRSCSSIPDSKLCNSRYILFWNRSSSCHLRLWSLSWYHLQQKWFWWTSFQTIGRPSTKRNGTRLAYRGDGLCVIHVQERKWHGSPNP